MSKHLAFTTTISTSMFMSLDVNYCLPHCCSLFNQSWGGNFSLWWFSLCILDQALIFAWHSQTGCVVVNVCSMFEPMNLFCCVHAHASLANHKLFVKCDESIGPLNSVVTIRCDLSKVEIALRRIDVQSHLLLCQYICISEYWCVKPS